LPGNVIFVFEQRRGHGGGNGVEGSIDIVIIIVVRKGIMIGIFQKRQDTTLPFSQTGKRSTSEQDTFEFQMDVIF
jgi:hypothetical protein